VGLSKRLRGEADNASNGCNSDVQLKAKHAGSIPADSTTREADMSDTIVRTESFINALNTVKLLTVKANLDEDTMVGYGLYYAIVKNGKVEFTSPLIYGGSKQDVIRNIDSALQVVRQLLTDTGFLTGEVVG
jgi:hypothetical protein